MTGLQLILHVRSENISPLNDCWIGQDKPMAWPPRSPDLTPMAFFIRGHIKDLIYTSPVDFKRILLPVLLRQQQLSGNNMAFMSVC